MTIISEIALWFQRARPNRGTQSMNAQTGVHFEEVSEMLAEMVGLDGDTRLLIEKAKLANHELAEHLKSRSKEKLYMVPEENRIRFIDALCDQVVTATGCAHDHRMDINNALNAVSVSNWSKYDEAGQPIFDENGKIKKGPNYQKADLSPYV